MCMVMQKVFTALCMFMVVCFFVCYSRLFNSLTLHVCDFPGDSLPAV